MTGKYQPNGYLYVPSYDKTGIYKINLSNSTNITLISLALHPRWGVSERREAVTAACRCWMISLSDMILRSMRMTTRSPLLPGSGAGMSPHRSSSMYTRTEAGKMKACKKAWRREIYWLQEGKLCGCISKCGSCPWYAWRPRTSKWIQGVEKWRQSCISARPSKWPVCKTKRYVLA